MSQQRMPENRGWVLDPTGHRHLANSGEVRQTGEQIDTPFGKATIIVLPPPADMSDWVCDFCNEIILTLWGDEPWPVAMIGNSYALCNECRLDYEKSPASDLDGENLYEPTSFDPTYREGPYLQEVLQGPWPFSLCSCGACYQQALIWRTFIEPLIWKNKSKIAEQN